MATVRSDQPETMAERTVTVWALVLGLIEYGADRGVRSFPPNGDPLWHEWLYDVRRYLQPLFPQLSIGQFDWDRAYPTHHAIQIMYMATLGHHIQRLPGDCRIVFRSRRRGVNPFEADPALGEYDFNLAKNRPGFFEF